MAAKSNAEHQKKHREKRKAELLRRQYEREALAALAEAAYTAEEQGILPKMFLGRNDPIQVARSLTIYFDRQLLLLNVENNKAAAK